MIAMIIWMFIDTRKHYVDASDYIISIKLLN